MVKFNENPIETGGLEKDTVKSVIVAIKANPSLLNNALGIGKRKQNLITVDNLYTLASNHGTDDNPENFGISKQQAHALRAYFYNNDGKKSILEIRDWFPEMFDEEDAEFLSRLK